MPDGYGPLLAEIDERSRRIDEIVRQAAAGERDQLDEMIDAHSEELSGRGGSYLVIPEMNLSLAGTRADRAALYLERYLRDDRLDDLVEAVADMETVFERLKLNPWIDLGPSLNARYHSLLGSALVEQFDHTGDRSTLDRAMGLLEVAAGEQPAESSYLASLAFARLARYEHAERRDELGVLDDLDEAIVWLDAAIERLPAGDVNRGPWLSSLSTMWVRRFDRDYDLSNLDRGIERGEAALDSVTSTADRVAALHAHGAAKRALCQHAPPLGDDLDDGRDSLAEAIEIGREAPSRFGLVAARDAAQWALERGDDDEAVVVGEAGLAILRGMNTRQRVPSHTEPWLRVAVDLAADTAWAMVATGDDLGAALTLEHARTTVLSALLPDPGGDTLTDEELRAIGATIPLCYLAMSTKSAFALVVDEHTVRVVVLDSVDVTAAKHEFRSHWSDVVLGRGATDIHRTCRDVGASDEGIDSSRPTPSRRDAIGHLVDWLDDAVMGPLGDEIGGRAAVLIPTGAFAGLPLHAGSVNSGGDMQWTFAPSARALRGARARAATCTSDALLAVVDPNHNRTPPLPGAATEVAEIAPLYAEQRILTGPATDARTVLDALASCGVVHFACHGRGDVRHPMNSALLLAGSDKLVLRELIGEVAFDGIRLVVLSACETNVASRTLPDEAVSFASGLLHAGAAGVIGSLWAVPDQATRHLMVEFHRRWRGGDGQPADALRGAQIAMRTGELGDGDFTHPENWAGFVYIGA